VSRGPGESRPLTVDLLRETFVDLDTRHREIQAERMAALRQLHELYDMEKAPGWVQMLLLGDDAPVVDRRLAERVHQELVKCLRQ
jgi:hypothetical protein